MGDIVMTQASAIILAGGKSKRIGINKPFIKLRNQYLIEIVVKRLKEIFREIIIVTNKKNYTPMIRLWQNSKNNFSPVVIQDKIANKGPLGGLFAGLLAIKNPYAFVCACDMPYLNKTLIKYLAKKIKNYDAVVPKSSGNNYEMLHSFYNRNCLKVIERNLRRNKLSLRQLLPLLQVYYVIPEKIKKIDPLMLSFANINTKSDLKRLKDSILY